jgi:hypothetical protein
MVFSLILFSSGVFFWSLSFSGPGAGEYNGTVKNLIIYFSGMIKRESLKRPELSAD